MTSLQPLLHDQIVILRAPTQAWSSPDGDVGDRSIHGFYHSDVRIVSRAEVSYDAQAAEAIATIPGGADRVSFVGLLRHLDDTSADPRVRVTRDRRVSISGVSETLTLESTLTEPRRTRIVVQLASDLADMDAVKSGRADAEDTFQIDGTTARWGNDAVSASLSAPGASLSIADGLTLTWIATIPAKGRVVVGYEVTASDSLAVVRGVPSAAPWNVPVVTTGDERLSLWVTTALDDLDALRLSTTDDPDQQFLAAGAPWFFTLFGRDSLWAARFMLPLGTRLAADTLRVLAGLQGTARVADTAEQPGKIMHELRRGTLSIPGEGVVLPPLYYGTVDATPLWVCLLHDAWRWGLADDEVRALLPHLERALEWMRDFGDADGDGLLEYVDETGHGLANQGWKDSGDSVQWRDGSLADGPIALCEV